MPLRKLVEEAGSFDPALIKSLSDVLEDVWLEVGAAFAGESQEVAQAARTVVAKSLLYHAGNGHTQPAILKSLALEALSSAYPKIPF